MADNEIHPTSTAGGGAAKGAEARAAHWCSMLLDFSRRNRLLNFKDGPAAVELDVPMADVLEDGLSSSKGYRIEMEAASDLAKGILRPKPGTVNAAKRLLGLVRAARNDLEEGGARTLYLSLGALYWKDGAGEKAPVYRAPLVLVPVELKRLPGSTRFEVHRADAETEGNVTLQEMLRRERRVRRRHRPGPPLRSRQDPGRRDAALPPSGGFVAAFRRGRGRARKELRPVRAARHRQVADDHEPDRRVDGGRQVGSFRGGKARGP